MRIGGYTIKSHIQLPKSVVKHFKSFDGKIYYLDLQLERIRSAGANIIGTEEGYFSGDMEKYLCKEIESPFATMVCKTLQSIENRSTDKEQYDELTECLRNYVLASYSRGKEALKRFQQKSYTVDLLPEQEKHDAVSEVFIEVSKDDLFRDYIPAALKSMTERKFVVPRNCFYFLPCGDLQIFVVPVRPEWAFIFVPPECAKEKLDGRSMTVYEIENPTLVEKLNEFALRWEYVYNKEFVASNDKNELDRLKEYLISHREEIASFSSD